ncbi:MAG: pentapeptide repeat-containing protein [Promethearchaeota archaeon]
MSWKSKVKNWNGKLYKVLKGNRSCHGGNFEWSLPEGDKPGDWTPIIEDVIMCCRGYHLTTHYAHWSDGGNISIYEAEGDVVAFNGYDKVVCTRARLLRLVENPFNNNNSGINNSGFENIGSYNSGNWNSGSYNSGNYNSGYSNSGNCNSGNCNSGDENSGHRNFGNWNSGNYNSGYFCTNDRFNGIFNKPIPEDWKPKFPEWIYFNLLPEGYKVSWQKAFEKASIEGIKELLDLPNFDYEIFEEISFITKKQIKEKLGE